MWKRAALVMPDLSGRALSYTSGMMRVPRLGLLLLISPTQFARQIRFHLESLGMTKAHHPLEQLCLGLTRRRVASNVIPGTGPVSASGDRERRELLESAGDGNAGHSVFHCARDGTKPL